MPRDRAWSPHPLYRPAALLVGLVHLAAGLALMLDAFFFPSWVDRPTAGPFVAAGVVLIVALGFLLIRALGPLPRRLVPVVVLPALAVVFQFVASVVRDGSPHPGVTSGLVLVVVGVLVVAFSEWRRRSVRILLEGDRLVVSVPRYRLEHELPLEAVREVTASRRILGRVFGYGDFTAKVRKGTMKDRITKPVVGEEPREAALRGHGWDEEELFHVRAAHPYRALRRELENRILLARLPPKDREAAALANRLVEDLGHL